MGTRTAFTFIRKGHKDYITGRHWNGFPSMVAYDLYDTDCSTTESIMEALGATGFESGIDFHYYFDMDNGTIKVYESDFRDDSDTEMVFEGTVGDFIKQFDEDHK